MRDHGWDAYKSFWIVGAVILSAPFVILAPYIVPFIIGAILFWFGRTQWLSFQKVESWIVSRGKLLNTEMGIYRVAESQYSPPTPYYFPMAHYSYCHQGLSYENNIYAFDKKSIWSKDKSKTEHTIESLTAEKEIIVYLNPSNPNQSALNINIAKSRYSQAYSLLVSGVIIFALGVYLCASNG
jgi:hypothetical protein